MKKVFQMLMVVTVIVATAASVGFVATPCASAATASDIVCNDKLIPTNSVVSITLSKTYTSRPIWLSVTSAYPDNGTVTVRWLHTRADETVQTNTTAAITLTSGAVSTNLASLFTQWNYPREPVDIVFSTATNGAFQLVGELYGIGK